MYKHLLLLFISENEPVKIEITKSFKITMKTENIKLRLTQTLKTNTFQNIHNKCSIGSFIQSTDQHQFFFKTYSVKNSPNATSLYGEGGHSHGQELNQNYEVKQYQTQQNNAEMIYLYFRRDELLCMIFYIYFFIEIHHKQHNNYRSLEFKISKIKLLWRGKKDRHSQLPYSMVKANKNNKNRQSKFSTKIWNQNNRWGSLQNAWQYQEFR